jgi:glutathione S-transferase
MLHCFIFLEGKVSPMGYLPVLEVDGKKLCESLAIMRFVAKECGN